MAGQEWYVALTLGFLLLAALVGGGVAGYLRVPKVTAFLLTGLVLGPGVLHWIRHEHLGGLETLTKLAIALVLFNLGCHFPLSRIRRVLRRVLRFSFAEIGLTFVLVFSGLLLVGARWEAALLLGALAVATAPATTILVLKEAESEGPITEHALSLVAINNLAAIVLFEVLFLAIHFVQDKLPVPFTAELGFLARDLAGSLVLGVAGGLIVSYAFALVDETRRLVLLVAIVVLLLSLCQLAQTPYLLTFLAMGATVANCSDQSRPVLAELDRITGLLCVVFFVIHGAELNLKALGQAGLVGFAYVVLRIAGKCLGIRLAAHWSREEPAVRRWLGPTLLAQAGAAIALAAIAVKRTDGIDGQLHQLCLDVQAIILGTVVVFELAGPLLIRHAVLMAGEVPLAHAIYHSSSSLTDQARTVWNQILLALGRDPWKGRVAEEVEVSELMRKSIKGLPQEAGFDDVVAYIEHSRNNTYPVVGSDGELVGVIRYRELSAVLFDPALNDLVRAADLTTPAGWVLHPDESLSRAYELFEATKDDCLPVVAREKPYHLLGLVRRRDLLRLLMRSGIDTPSK